MLVYYKNLDLKLPFPYMSEEHRILPNLSHLFLPIVCDSLLGVCEILFGS